MAVAFQWVRVRVRVRVRAYVILKVCQPHAKSFHRSFRGSRFSFTEATAEASMGFVFESFRGRNILFIISFFFTSTKASAKAYVKASSVKASVKTSAKASVEANFLPRKLP